jgi:hypothetical protein
LPETVRVIGQYLPHLVTRGFARGANAMTTASHNNSKSQQQQVTTTASHNNSKSQQQQEQR